MHLLDATPSLAARAVALIAFVGLLAGATVGAYNAILPAGVDSQLVTMDVIGQDLRVAPGGAASAAVVVSTAASANTTATLSVADDGGLVVDAPASMDIVARKGGGAWVTLHAPADAAEGPHTATLHLRMGDEDTRPRVARITVHVEQPGEAVMAGDSVTLRYTGLLEDGSVFGTNVKAVADSPLPKAHQFNPARLSFDALSGTAGPNSSAVPGFWEALVGVGVGHSATFTVAPHRAFGNASILTETDRVETVNRTIEWPRTYDGDRQFFEGILNESSELGDRVFLGQGGGSKWPFVVTAINDTHATIAFDAEVGDTFTHYTQWPNSSELVTLNETSVVFQVTPTTDLGEEFTWIVEWPNTTRVVELTPDEIYLQHSPPEGLTYTRRGQSPQAPPVTYTVESVEPDVIVLSRPNPAPLAGETVTFHVTVEGIGGHGDHTH